ncbi:coiled-coil-helix-coiled-coil-helix domain-containing protein 2-like [Aotus nancymaae]|uniref:coiled-coil-helix-coiled-coil-helix domain-containing protein 2-like n=1 Tax=Aotus nancymaae TaxID=37293 RepID=UPI0030FF1887
MQACEDWTNLRRSLQIKKWGRLRGSRSCTSCMAPPASRAPQMRAAPRPAPAAQPPAVASPSAVGSPAAVRQPGLLSQMATTAAGVAVGSAVGHTLGHAITGGFSGGSDPEPARPDITSQEPQRTQPAQQQQPCFYEIKQFLECAQNQGDIKLCEGFSEVLKLPTCKWIDLIKKFKLEKWKTSSYNQLNLNKNLMHSEGVKCSHQLNLSRHS